jgi:arginase family enzyme
MMIDVRNLDAEEEALIRATDVQIVRFSNDAEFSRAIEVVRAFAARVDHLYVHIDADVLDASLQPNHPTVEPDGLSVAQTLALVEAAMEPGTVAAFGVVSINPEEPGGRISLQSGMDLIEGGVTRWLSAGSRV